MNNKKADENIGLIHIYTGDGKGKTSICIGSAIRALGQKMKVYFIQFQKGQNSGEINVLQDLKNLDLKRVCTSKTFYYYMSDEEKEAYAKEHKNAFLALVEEIKENPDKYDMLILDEILGLVSLDIISNKELLDFLRDKPKKLEVLLSGRRASQELIDIADYVSDLKAIKHPFTKNISGRRGIEY